MSSHPSKQETAQQEQGTNLLNQGAGDVNTALTNPQSSPLYKSLLSSGLSGVSNQYQNAQQNALARASQAGFGGSPAISGASQEGAQLAEANALAQIPNQAALESSQALMQGGQEIGGMGNDFLTGGDSLARQRMASQSALWGSLLGAGATLGKGLMDMGSKGGGN